MKKSLLSLAVFVIGVAAYSQIPSTNPGKPKLPVPKIQPLTPADLQVTDISLISVTKDNAAKKLVIRVSVTIKNNGQVRAGSSGLKAYFHSPSGTGTARAIEGNLSVGAVDPGASVSGEYTFRRPFSGDAGFTLVRFDFWVKADAANVVRESNEGNNSSVTIQITPPSH